MELSELIESIDIVEYISQFVDLEQKGDEFWGLSCFKDEKTPSFSVRSQPPVFYDYSSGIGGNIFTFVRRYNRCSAAEAVDILRKYVGDEGHSAPIRQKMSATKVFKHFRTKKSPQKPVKVTVLPDDYMERYENDREKLSVWLQEGISQASLDRFQVKYDAFSDRLVYPIRNLEGKIVNVGGRALDPRWKEQKQPKYCYFFPWGSLDILYGLYENMESIKKERQVILFEGCKSVLLADTWGIHNTAAVLTSHLNPNQMKLLAKLGVSVLFALDKDVDVTADHNINRLKRYVDVKYIRDDAGFLGAKDSPADKGKEVFSRLVTQCSHQLV